MSHLKSLDLLLARLTAGLLSLPPGMRLARELQAAWRNCVDEPTASHVRPLLYSDRRLLLEADSGVWASRFWHQRQTVLNKLRLLPGFRDLRDMHVRVSPATLPTAPVPRRASPVSSQAAKTILGMADEIEDPSLRAALTRLARSANQQGQV